MAYNYLETYLKEMKWIKDWAKKLEKNVFLKGQWVPNKQTKMDGLRKTIRDFN